MVLKYGPFNGTENAWDAYDFAEFFKLFFGNGVFPNPSNNLQILAHENMQTKVSIGVGFVEGHKISNTSDFILQHDIADGVLKRIDRVVMRANFLQNKGEIIVKKGTPANSPVAPTLVRNTDYYELALADVLINNGATVITQANITDQRLNTALCGVVATNITQLDTTTLALQYQAAFEQMTIEQQQEFVEWVDSLKDILDENVAATLASRLTTVEVDVSEIEQDVSNIDTRLTQHLAQNASTTQSGHVQLNNTVTSTSTIQAATANAVKTAYDRAEAAFSQANDIKTKWASVVGSPLVSSDTQAQLQTKTQTIKDTLASNLSAKGQTASGTETLTSLVNKVANVNTGRKYANGTATTGTPTLQFQFLESTNLKYLDHITVSGLTFRPSKVTLVKYENNANVYITEYIRSLGSLSEVASTSFYNGLETANDKVNRQYKANTSPAYVNATGFRLPVETVGTYYWEAWE